MPWIGLQCVIVVIMFLLSCGVSFLTKRGLVFGKFREGLRSFEKKKPSRNGENTLSLTNVGKSCQSCAWQISLLKLFAKIKFS